MKVHWQKKSRAHMDRFGPVTWSRVRVQGGRNGGWCLEENDLSDTVAFSAAGWRFF